MLSPSTSAFAMATATLLLAYFSLASAADSTADLIEQLAQDLSASISGHIEPTSTPVFSPADASAGQPALPLDTGHDKPMAGLLGKRSCGAEPLSIKQMAVQAVRFSSAARLMNSEDGNNSSGGLGVRGEPNYGPLVKKVNVYWHVIRKSSEISQGNLPQSAIAAQMEVMNQKYQKANIRFNLAGMDYTTNKDWYNVRQGTEVDNSMRRALHRGSMKDLNVYSAVPRGASGDLIAGYTKMPEYGQLDPTLDGSVILHTTLPGGSEPKFNLGLTLVHEIGHAFGLMHPFDHGCNFPGDAIGDTVYQREAIYDCTPQKTCPSRPGETDPIDNPMGYAPDACMKTFTDMQNKKIRKAWYAYRYSPDSGE